MGWARGKRGLVMRRAEQGDLLKVAGLNYPALVVSNMGMFDYQQM